MVTDFLCNTYSSQPKEAYCRPFLAVTNNIKTSFSHMGKVSNQHSAINLELTLCNTLTTWTTSTIVLAKVNSKSSTKRRKSSHGATSVRSLFMGECSPSASSGWRRKMQTSVAGPNRNAKIFSSCSTWMNGRTRVMGVVGLDSRRTVVLRSSTASFPTDTVPSSLSVR